MGHPEKRIDAGLNEVADKLRISRATAGGVAGTKATSGSATRTLNERTALLSTIETSKGERSRLPGILDASNDSLE